MAIGDVWYYDLGKTPMIEVGLRKGHYLISGKAQFDQIPGSVPPIPVTFGAITLLFGYSNLRKIDESVAYLSRNHDADEGTEGGTCVVQAAISVDEPDPSGHPGRVVFRALTEETSLSRAKLVVRQVNRIFEQSEVKLKVPAYKLTGFETAESAAEGLKNQSVSGDWGQVAGRPK